jgi:hypothetical protein
MDRRIDEIDARFDAVDAAFLEQRQYTEFAFQTLAGQMAGQMKDGFEAMSSHFARLERKFDTLIDTHSTTWHRLPVSPLRHDLEQ